MGVARCTSQRGTDLADASELTGSAHADTRSTPIGISPTERAPAAAHEGALGWQIPGLEALPRVGRALYSATGRERRPGSWRVAADARVDGEPGGALGECGRRPRYAICLLPAI